MPIPGIAQPELIRVNETIRLAQVSHTSWLGPCCPASLEKDGSYQKNIDKLAKNAD